MANVPTLPYCAIYIYEAGVIAGPQKTKDPPRFGHFFYIWMEFRVLIRFRCYKLGEIHFRVSLEGSKILVNICWPFRQHWSTPSCHYGSKNGIIHGWKGDFTDFIYIWMVFWVLIRFWCYKLREIYFSVSLRGFEILVNMCWPFSQQRDAFWAVYG